MPSTISHVAQVVAVSSTAVVNGEVQLPQVSPFSHIYNANGRSSEAKFISLPFGADIGSTLLRYRNESLTSVTVFSNPRLQTQLLHSLPEVSDSSAVVHIALSDTDQDLSNFLLLRSSVPFFVLSRTPDDAYRNALLLSKLSRVEKKAAIHVFYDKDAEISPLTDDEVRSFLWSDAGKVDRSDGNTTKPHSASHLYGLYQSIASSVQSLFDSPSHPLSRTGNDTSPTLIITVARPMLNLDIDGVTIIDLSLLSPLPPLHNLLSPSTERILVLEQAWNWPTKWSPLYLDVLGAVQQLSAPHPSVRSVTLGTSDAITADSIRALLEESSTSSPSARLSIGPLPQESPSNSNPPFIPKHEASYTKILDRLFSDRLEIANSPSLVSSEGYTATSPEYALGRLRKQFAQREELASLIESLLQDYDTPTDLHKPLSRWLASRNDPIQGKIAANEVINSINGFSAHPLIQPLLSLTSLLRFPSRWIIGSDAWSYDIGSSGIHHLIASGLNANILILDTTPYSVRNTVDPHRRKKDIGLYAMNHGDVYVASVAVYSSYSQVLQALIEADKFNGPSVVLAYLPYFTEDTSPLEILKETKMAVDAGYWPLYRWNPAKEREGKDPFALDSDSVKNDLQQFLDRQNHLSQLTTSKPQFASELVSSLGETVKEARKNRAKQAYSDLLTNIDAPPLLVLYGSDGGTAEKMAKRLANRGKLRGLSTTVSTMDSVSLDDLAKEEYIAFVTSTAGQGEFPQNARTLWKAISAAATRGDRPFTKTRFTVFAMGDSHYWPRPEDAHYYSKPGKDLNAKLESLGAERFVELGLGDDQDADGPETGYKLWEPKLWKALGIDNIEIKEAEPELITNEHIKAASKYLRGTIAQGLVDNTTGALSPSDTQLTKFHGVYQQDDRDIRDERQAQGVEPAYAFMIRVRMSGGICDPQQWLLMDQIADEHGNGTFKITTRQTFQFHGVIKRHLKPAIQDINRALFDTLAACGDVNRNVLCSAIPTRSKLHAQVYHFAKVVSEHLIPQTTAYHEIWLDKKMVAGDAVKDVEPLYGELYLPRKFKIAVVVPPSNDVDVFANDVGFIAIVNEKGGLVGFNVTAGGGMGVTHGDKKTYPRTADVLGFCTVEQGKDVAEKIMLVQRDNGNRADRKNARLKYTIDRMGLENFQAEVEQRLGYRLQPARPFNLTSNVDEFGWVTGEDGRHHYTTFIENGRVQDEPEKNFKTGLREIAKVHKGDFRLTANQHVIISGVSDKELPEIKRLLAEYKLDNLNHSGLRLSSSACVAFPTCGLAMAESERYLPVLIGKVEKICEENGLRNDSIVMRMTGCPNGCSRPYLGEVAFVGKAQGSYMMLLGGGYYGQRLNKIYRESVAEPEILEILRPMIKRYALEREEGEHFGDFVIRAGYIAPTLSGLTWYDRMGGEGVHRDIAVAA
ncbi:sulfite reductase subunit beta [Thelephora ganbajun]|uniref:Sulfite reductase subunit beta n=1 Tax=Thelephora ganbajun TaxID=370292 RepID=A0ACB6Z9G5_THEGA|nr:sulfite reductase subunit beta [Thelephora ganbajun]